MKTQSRWICAVCLIGLLYATSAVEATLARGENNGKEWKRVDIALDTKNLRRFTFAFDRNLSPGILALLRQTNIDRAFEHHREQFYFTVYLSMDGTELKVMNKAGDPVFLMNYKRQATVYLKRGDHKYVKMGTGLTGTFHTKNFDHRLCFKVPKSIVDSPSKMFARIVDLGGTGSKRGDFEKKCNELSPQECRRFDLCRLKVEKAEGLLKGMFGKKKRTCEIYETKNVKRDSLKPWGKCEGDMGTQLSLRDCRATKIGRRASIYVTLRPQDVEDTNGDIVSIKTREMVKYKVSGGYDEKTGERTTASLNAESYVKGKITSYRVENKKFSYGKGIDQLEFFLKGSNGDPGLGMEWWNGFTKYVQHSFHVEFEKCMWAL